MPLGGPTPAEAGDLAFSDCVYSPPSVSRPHSLDNTTILAPDTLH